MLEWNAIGLAALLGAIGGLTLDVIQDGALDLPRIKNRKVYLGFMTDMLAGAVGGVVAALSTGTGQVSPQLLADALSGSGVAALFKAAGAWRTRQQARHSSTGAP